MEQKHPNVNTATTNNIIAGTLGSAAGFEVRRGLLQFDLTVIPPGAVINSVTVRLTAIIKIPSGAQNSTFDLRRMLAPWSESQVTWNQRLAGTGWANPGALDPTDSAPGASSSVLVRGLGAYTFPSTPALVADVQGWVTDPQSNFGWMLHSEAEAVPKTARHFATREYPVTNSVPQLIINYTVPSISIVAQPESQTTTVGSDVTFSVGVNGAPPFAYQWQFNGKAIPGETNNTLQLTNVQLTAAGDYKVTVSNQVASVESLTATLKILTISITSPTNNAVFPPGSDVLITTDANETNGVTQVEFFQNTNSVGVSLAAPFSLLLTNLQAGTYFLNVVATDLHQLATTSSVVRITVVGPPSVLLTISPFGTNFPLGTTLTNTAVVTTAARVTQVQFFALGIVTNAVGIATNAPFAVAWTPTEAGLYSLFAVAMDQFGQAGTSAPVSIRIHIPEATPPRIVITNGPANFSRQNSSQVTLSGTARDNIGVDHVEYRLEYGPFLGSPGTNGLAEGTTNWLANIHLVPGNNAIHLRSLDFAGNTSSELTRFYTYVVTQALTVQITGSGTVSPNLNGRVLEIGKPYQMTARPSAGSIFAGWDGLAHTNYSSTLNFVMESNLTTLVASFTNSPFLPGSYLGVYFDTNSVSPDSSGFLSLSLLQNGSFNGRLSTRGTSYAVGGQFDFFHRVTVPVLRHALAPVVLALQVDENRLKGFVTNLIGTNVVSSQLVGGRNNFNARTNPAPQPAQLGFRISRTNQMVIGGGLATIAKSGTVRIRGQWVNHLNFSLGSSLILPTPSGASLPFYLSFRGGTEIIIGLPFFGVDQNDVSGELWWVRSGTNHFKVPLEIGPALN